MHIIDINMFQTGGIAAIVLVIGQFLVNRIEILRKYCIPSPVVGGFLFAIIHTILRSMGILELNMDMTLKDIFMIPFFCSVGYTAAFKSLKKGGIKVVMFLGLALVMVLMQDIIGAIGASFFHLDPKLGLAMGSIPLIGGHGTAGSFGPELERLGVLNANAVAIAAATYGLVAGCVIGGPVAYSKIKKYNLHSEENETEDEVCENKSILIDSDKVLDACIYLLIGVGIGSVISNFLGQYMTFPSYIGAMLVGAIVRNYNDVKGNKMPMDEMNALGNTCLSIFLGLAMIDMKLWQLISLAVPMIVILFIQTLFVWFYASHIVFPILGKNYDANVMASGFCGFGMGATPNAMANMQAVTKLYGPSPVAFMVVPLVGSLFIDFFNASILTAFINFLPC